MNSLKVDLCLLLLQPFILYAFTRLPLRKTTSVRAENATFCNYISTYADNKAVCQELIKKIWSCDLSNKTCWNTIWCVSVQSPCFVLNSQVVGWVRPCLIHVQTSKLCPKWCACFTVIKRFCGTITFQT